MHAGELVWQASRVRMRRAWELEAWNWARFARTPGYDHSHEDINLPALLELLPAPGSHTLDLGCGEGRLGRILHSAGHQVVGIDAPPTTFRSPPSSPMLPGYRSALARSTSSWPT